MEAHAEWRRLQSLQPQQHNRVKRHDVYGLRAKQFLLGSRRQTNVTDAGLQSAVWCADAIQQLLNRAAADSSGRQARLLVAENQQMKSAPTRRSALSIATA